jgi:hypothetical protein
MDTKGIKQNVVDWTNLAQWSGCSVWDFFLPWLKTTPLRNFSLQRFKAGCRITEVLLWDRTLVQCYSLMRRNVSCRWKSVVTYQSRIVFKVRVNLRDEVGKKSVWLYRMFSDFTS